MDITKVKRAPYNPRTLSKKTKEALKRSIETFSDISGITVNKRTGNIVSGNHRWEDVCSRYGGQNKLTLNHIVREYFSLDTKTGVHTGFLVRIVDWDKDKEKAANITANSDLVSGEFTPDLQNILSDLKLNLNEELFNELRFDELYIDLESLDNDLDIRENVSRKREKTEETSRKKSLKKNETELSLIKISCPDDMTDEIKDDLLEFLSKKKYYERITIV